MRICDEDLAQIEEHLREHPTSAAVTHAPQLIEWCRELLKDRDSLIAEMGRRDDRNQDELGRQSRWYSDMLQQWYRDGAVHLRDWAIEASAGYASIDDYLVVLRAAPVPPEPPKRSW